MLERLQRKVERYIDQSAGVEPRALSIGRARHAGWSGCECVFVLSTGRTGTQTLAALLDLSPHIVAEHEPLPRLILASRDAFQEEVDEQWKEKWIPYMRSVRGDQVMVANKAGKIYAETNNRLTFMARALREAFPASKFIFSHRGPYKVVRSGMQRGAYQGGFRAWNFANIHPRSWEKQEPWAGDWEHFSPLQKEAWRWSRVNAEALAFFEELPGARQLKLPARALFSGGGEVYQRMFDFVGACRPSMRQLEQVLGKRKNAQAHYDGQAFAWTAARKDAVRPIIRGMAHRLGYEV